MSTTEYIDKQGNVHGAAEHLGKWWHVKLHGALLKLSRPTQTKEGTVRYLDHLANRHGWKKLSYIDIELQSHTGKWERVTIQADSIAEAVYRAIRLNYTFLTDDNHTHEIDGIAMGKIVIRRTASSPPPHAITPSWALPDYKPGGFWFSVPFRAVPTDK